MKSLFGRALAGAVLIAACQAGAAAAQDPGDADLDALISATESDAGALVLARSQVGSGDLTGAAVTLERSLLQRSGSDDVRLYYGTVLCRLGDQRRGAYQLSSVRNASASGWTEARAACGNVPIATTGARDDGARGLLTFGLGYDSDAFNVLISQFEVPGFSPITDEGVSAFGSAAIEARFASDASGHGYAGAALQGRSEISGPEVDYLIGGLRAGYAFNLAGEDRTFAAGLIVRHALLAGDSLVTEIGGQAEYSVALGGNRRWAVKAEAVSQDYQPALFDPFRDGSRYDLELSYTEAPEPGRAWTIGVAAEAKDADQEELGYRGARAFAATQFPIHADGTYFGASGVIRRADFRDVPAALDQSETRMYLRAAVGRPLNQAGLSVEAAATFSGRWYDDSSFYDSNSVGAELRLVYRFGQ